jgi:hypothetical protein
MKLPAQRPWLQGILTAGALATALACPTVRQPPAPEPQPDPPPAVVEELPLPLTPAEEDSGARVALQRAQALLTLETPDADWLAESLLTEAGRLAAADGQAGLQSQALFLAGLVQLQWGLDARAEELLEAARVADRHGPHGATARLALHLLREVRRQEDSMAQLRQELARSEQGRREQEEVADRLATQVHELNEQIEELKEVHLRVESEKEDSPS